MRWLCVVLLATVAGGTRAQAGEPYAAWRVDGAVSASRLSKGLQPWRDQTIVLTYRPESDLWLSAGLERSSRFGLTDTLVRLQVARSLSNEASLTASISQAPDAVFRSRSAIQVGYAAPRLGVTRTGWTLGAGLDASAAHYKIGTVNSVQPYLILGSPTHATATLKVIQTRDEGGKQTSGYAVSAETPLTRGLGFKATFVDAPESESGLTLQTRATSEALSWDINDGLSLRLFGIQEQRSSFDRNEYGLSFARRF